MALNLDDKILGERVQCFVSDSESESESENNGDFFKPNIRTKAQTKPQKPQTGPKGVLADHKRFQETGKLESENSAESDCSSDSSLCISDDDEIFEKYREGRLREMNQKERVRLAEQKILAMEKQQELLQDYQGKVIQLDENNYLENVESSGKVVLLLYDIMNENSAVLNKCINVIAEKIPHVRFCRAEYQNIAQSCSRYLARNGLPCLIGNFEGRQTGALVWPDISFELGESFQPEHLESLLLEKQFL